MSTGNPLKGRQAEALRNDRVVLEAARRVFAKRGVAAPVTAVAEEAGVGIGTLYRRYGGKQELLQHLCVLSLQENLDAANAALAAGEAWAGLAAYIRRCVDFGAGAFAPVAGTISTTDEMRWLAVAVRRSVEMLTDRAHREGSVRTDVNGIDVLQLVEHFSRAHGRGSGSGSEVVRARQLAIALSGLRTKGAVPLPTPAPSPEQYEAAWR